ncbi:MAG: transcriptional regulator [Planctomycetota bacterium]|nr:transcriptional regulator [Planctomycetota bacterium]
MSTSEAAANAKQDEIPTDLIELTEAIESLPVEHRVKLLPSLRRVTEGSVRRRRILSLVQEALGQLRLDMKYLVFDLEATKRERDEFLEKLTELGGDEGSAG